MYGFTTSGVDYNLSELIGYNVVCCDARIPFPSRFTSPTAERRPRWLFPFLVSGTSVVGHRERVHGENAPINRRARGVTPRVRRATGAAVPAFTGMLHLLHLINAIVIYVYNSIAITRDAIVPSGRARALPRIRLSNLNGGRSVAATSGGTTPRPE